MVNQFEAERSQNLVVLLDAGRAMSALAEPESTEEDAEPGLTKLDYALNAALLLAHVALGNVCVQLGRIRAAGRALDAATALLEHRDPGDVIDEGDGLTVGRLAELVILQRARTLRPAG